MRQALLTIGLLGLAVARFDLGLSRAGAPLAAKLKSETTKAWLEYQRLTEKRITTELDSQDRFLVQDFLAGADAVRCRQALASGAVFTLRMETLSDAGKQLDVPGGLIHHWFGSIVVPKANLPDLLNWIQDYDHHDKYFREVESSRLISRQGDVFKIFLRLVRKKIITVHYNTEHVVEYRRHAANRISSKSYATKIAQLEDAGTPAEHERPPGDDGGYLWRLNSYWRFQQQDSGVVITCESISLSRSIPAGLQWLIKGYLESVPRESLTNTLTSIREGFHSARGDRRD